VTEAKLGRWTVLDFDELDSTSDHARRLLEQDAGPTPPFLVRAGRQTKGRGRGSNAWFSSVGSLTVTLVLDPAAEAIERGRDPVVALIGAFSILDVAWDLAAVKPEVRWPNVVEAGGKKVAGLLCERIEPPAGPRLLLGVGVNVSTRFENAPADVQALATSLDAIRAPGAPEVDAASILARFLDAFDRYLASALADPAAFAVAVNAHDALSGRPVRILQGENIVEGVGRIVAIFGGQVLRN
jgi:BirA family biotin operon repressor/biotin-[acetyl-CoA-carboxylase] ligase